MPNKPTYYSLHREERKAASRAHYQRNKKRLAKEARERRKADPGKFKVQRNARRRAKPAKAMLYSAKERAKRLGLPFNLTLEDILIPEICPVLGIRLNKANARHAHNSPSIDRVNPRLGYVASNVRVISWRANKIKGDASARELEAVLRYMRGEV